MKQLVHQTLICVGNAARPGLIFRVPLPGGILILIPFNSGCGLLQDQAYSCLFQPIYSHIVKKRDKIGCREAITSDLTHLGEGGVIAILTSLEDSGPPSPTKKHCWHIWDPALPTL